MNLLKGVLPLLALLVCVIESQGQYDPDWINPDDMLNFDPASKTMMKQKVKYEPPPVEREPVTSESKSQINKEKPELEKENSECKCEQTSCPAARKCPPEKECVCEQACLPLLRNYIRSLVKNFDNQTPSSSNEYVMRISLSADQILILNRFVDKGSATHIHDVHEILTSMVEIVTTSNIGAMEKFALLLEHKIGLSLHRLIQFFMLAALASVVLMIEIRLQIAWRRRVSQLIVLMFVISIPWTWYELYKQAEIEQHSKTIRKIPAECQENASNSWKTLLSYFSLQKDVCSEYYESIMIDPIVKVPPTKAIAVTFVRFFMAPLKDVGTAFSEFLRALLQDLPVTYFPVAVIMVTTFFFLFLFMMFGYSIRLPFFLTIEKTQVQAVTDGQVQQTIGDGNKQILDQLQDITDRMKNNEIQFNERIEDIRQVQQMAIEHNISSASLSEPPSLSKPSDSGQSIISLDKGDDNGNPNVKGSDIVDSCMKTAADSRTVRKIPVNDCTDVNGDDIDDDDDDDAKKEPKIDTLLPDSFSNRDFVK